MGVLWSDRLRAKCHGDQHCMLPLPAGHGTPRDLAHPPRRAALPATSQALLLFGESHTLFVSGSWTPVHIRIPWWACETIPSFSLAACLQNMPRSSWPSLSAVGAWVPLCYSPCWDSCTRFSALQSSKNSVMVSFRLCPFSIILLCFFNSIYLFSF